MSVAAWVGVGYAVLSVVELAFLVVLAVRHLRSLPVFRLDDPSDIDWSSFA